MIAKKRLLSMITAVLLIVAMMPVITWNAYADDGEVVEYDGLRYRIEQLEDDTNTAIVLGRTHYNNNAEINIPQYIITDNEPCFVTEIGEQAFKADNNLTIITIPNRVEKIRKDAFKSCNNLRTVTFSEYSNLTFIRPYAFSECQSLTEIGIPPSVNTIDEGVFSNCQSLSSVSFGENSKLTFIGQGAFIGCSSLTAIDIPSSVNEIGSDAFSSTGLKSVVLPEGLELISNYTFYECSDLKEVTIPSTVKEIWGFSFYGCDSLETIHFGGSRPQWEAITGTGKRQLVEKGLEPADYGIPEIFLDSFKITIPEGRTKAFPGDTITLSIETEVTTEHDVSQVVFNFLMADAEYPTPFNFSTSSFVRNTETNRDVWEASEVVGNEDIGVWNAAAVTALSTPKTSIYYDPNVNLWPYPAPKADLSFMQFEVVESHDDAHHSWNTGKVTKAPTCTAVGNKHFTCTLCGTEKDEAIPAAGHKWNSSLTIDKAATYAAAGSKSIHCSVCNAKKPGSDVSIPKLKVKAVTLSTVKPVKNGFTAKWKKGSGINGYELQYALNSKFTKGKKTIKIIKPGTVLKKVTKLKANKKYYVRIRAYKKVSGKTYTSSWSKTKSVKTKPAKAKKN